MTRVNKWYKLAPFTLLLYLRPVKISKLSISQLFGARLSGLADSARHRPAHAGAILLSVCWLSACGTTPAPVTVVNAPAPVAQRAEPAPEPAVELMALETANNTTSDEPLPPADMELDADEEKQLALLDNARASLASDSKRALAISYHLQQSPYPAIRSQNLLVLLEAARAERQFALVQQLLLRTKLTDLQEQDRQPFSLNAAEFYQQQNDPQSAARVLLAADAWLGNSEDATVRHLLWQQLVQLSDAEVRELMALNRPRYHAWLELLQLTQSFAGDQASVAKGLADWQLRYPMMPALAQLPAEITTLVNTPAFNPQRIAVLLPLSGQFQTAGEAVQLGMIAAVTREQQKAGATSQSRQLIFIDSTQQAASIHAAVVAANADFVVGPLLREHIDQILQLPDWSWPTLFLNSKGERSSNHPNQFYYSLAWEDEAQQMVQVFRQRQIQHPVLIYAQNPIHLRMAQRFSQLWQEKTGKAPETYHYGSQDQLKTLINDFLDTAASEERAKELSRLAGYSVKAELHSRQDLDAIYLIADPVQTRFFKPFIDVTINPTARKVPIFTSSRSHSLKVDKTDQRDLAGLTMTEMPWLLPQSSIAPALRADFDQLFADQDEQLQRLFAMGHDAISLLPFLKQQQVFPTMAFHGLTGSLRLQNGQTVQRQLTLAQYRQGKLQLLDNRQQ